MTLLSIGILGLGGMGRTHARHYANVADCALTHGFDLDTARAAAFSADFPITLTDSAEALMDAVDAIDVCTPTPTHHPLLMEALKRGKPILCEKPMCRTALECEVIVEEVARRGVTFMPAQVLRYFPEFERAHKLVRDGAVGTPAAIRTRRGGAFPKHAGAWFGDFEQSGGVLLDLLVHDFDWLRWTFGEVERVYAKGLLFADMPHKDYALVTLRFASGALGHVEGSWADPGGFRATFEVCGDKGMIEYDSRKVYPVLVSREGEPQAKESPMLPGDDPYRRELAHFVERAAARKPTDITAEDGWKAVIIAESAVRSLRTGKPVRVGVTR